MSTALTLSSVPTWEPAADGLWSLERTMPGGFGLRTVALRLGDGSLAVVSPTRGLGDDAHAALRALGPPSVLLAPNQFHNMGVREALTRHPGATLVASTSAHRRLTSQTKLAFESLDALRAKLAPGHEVLEPEGLRNGESWVSVSTPEGRAWVVADAFFAMPAHPPGVMGLFCRLTGVSAGLRIGGTFKTIAVRDKRRYRAWLLAELERAPPAVLVPIHGVVQRGPDLAARLRALAESRL